MIGKPQSGLIYIAITHPYCFLAGNAF